MNLTLQIIKKDARRLAWPLALWLALIAADVGLGLGLAAGPAGLWDSFYAITLFHRILLGLQVVTCWVLTAQLVHEDPLVGTRAFWPTRPISRARLLGAKLRGLALLLWLPPVLILLPWWLSSGFGPGDLANVTLETMLRQAVITLPALVLASVTESLASFLVWAGAIIVVLLAGGLLGSVLAMAAPAVDPNLEGLFGIGARYAARDAAEAKALLSAQLLGALALGWLAAGGHQYLTGRRRRTVVLLAGWVVAAAGVAGYAQWDWTAIFWGDHPDYSAENYRQEVPAVAVRESSWLTGITLTPVEQATTVTGITVRLAGGRVGLVDRIYGDVMQLQLELDQAGTSRVAYPWAAATVWSWPDEPEHAPLKITLRAPQTSSARAVAPYLAIEPIFAQLLAGQARFIVPLNFVQREPDNARELAVPTPTVIELMTGSRHAVTTKVKLYVWEEPHLAEAPLRAGGRDPREPRRLRVLAWSPALAAGVLANTPVNLPVTLAGRGPAPAATLLGGVLNDGAWNLPTLIALVNRARAGFVLGDTATAEQQLHLRIGGVGLVCEPAAFQTDRFHSLAELAPAPLPLTGAVGRAQPALDAAWFDGASIVMPDFKPLGWVERELSTSDLKVPNYAAQAPAIAARDFLMLQNDVKTNFPNQPEVRAELETALDSAESSARKLLYYNGLDSVMTARLNREFISALDDVLLHTAALADRFPALPASPGNLRFIGGHLPGLAARLNADREVAMQGSH